MRGGIEQWRSCHTKLKDMICGVAVIGCRQLLGLRSKIETPVPLKCRCYLRYLSARFQYQQFVARCRFSAEQNNDFVSYLSLTFFVIRNSRSRHGTVISLVTRISHTDWQWYSLKSFRLLWQSCFNGLPFSLLVHIVDAQLNCRTSILS